MSDVTIMQGDSLSVLQKMPDSSVDSCVTSPPYWGLRDYGLDSQMGLEENPQDYVEKMVLLFRQVRRVIKPQGTLWLNLGDSYSSTAGKRKLGDSGGIKQHTNIASDNAPSRCVKELGGKQLIGIPWLVAFALQADGWRLRCDIVWHKPNPMPESVRDRPTRAHEFIFLFSKSSKYYYDIDAVKEPMSQSSVARLSQDIDSQEGSHRANGGAKTNGSMKAVGKLSHDSFESRKLRANPSTKSFPTTERNGMRPDKQRGHSRKHSGFNERWDQMGRGNQCSGMRNKRDVWTVAPANYREAHFATFPPKLIEPCVLAGTPPGGVVLDPFGGSGTTGEVARAHGRSAILIELNPQYVALINKRLYGAFI